MEEIDKLMEVYKVKNVRPKYVRHECVIDFDKFLEIIGDTCVAKEIREGLVGKWENTQGKEWVNVWEQREGERTGLGIEEKRKMLNYDGIFDEDLLKLGQ